MAPGESQESSPGVGENEDSAGEAIPLPNNRSELQLHYSESAILNASTSIPQRRSESITAELLQSSAPGMAASVDLLRSPGADSVLRGSPSTVSDRRGYS
jgi:hypothetical protein